MTARLAPPALLLASASPRRRTLLEGAGIPVVICPAEVDEALRPGEGPEAYVQRLARVKAEAGFRTASGAALRSPAYESRNLVLGADTSVVLKGRILGKPADEAEAREMLSSLAASWHEVCTGWCLLEGGAVRRQGVSTTRVRFKALTDAELRYYLGTGEWRDKAGAYGIQGAAASFVSELEGSYTNVVGLPLAEVVDALRELGLLPALSGIEAPSRSPASVGPDAPPPCAEPPSRDGKERP